MLEHSVFSVSNTSFVDDKPMNKPVDLDMSESLCFKGPTREHLVFEMVLSFLQQCGFVLYR